MIFLVTTGAILPFIDKVGRRMLLLSGAIICMALHFGIAAIMATRGHYVDSVNDNANLRWEIAGAPGKGVIACSYIFTGVYGLTWVSLLLFWVQIFGHGVDIRNRHLQHGFTPLRFSLSNIVRKEWDSLQPGTGSLTLHWRILLPRLSPISSGRRTSFLVYFAP